MFGQGPLNGFRVAPRSIESIRETARRFTSALDLVLPVPLAKFLEGLWQYGIVVDIFEPKTWGLSPEIEACWDPESLTLYLRQDVYEACRRNGARANFTVFHELGHAFLGHKRTLNRMERQPIPVWEDSEWQANQFAAEVTMPLQHIQTLALSSEAALMEHFNVSSAAARKRLAQLRRRGEIKMP